MKNHTKRWIYLRSQWDSRQNFLIKTGKVKIISVGESGKEIVKTILSSGDIFGERSIFGQQNYNDAAVAVEDTQVSILSSYQLKSLMKEHSSISLFLWN